MGDIESLVARMQEGDPTAFEELVAKYRNKVYALALTLAGNQADAEDLTQEIFLKIYLGFKEYAQKKGSFEALVHRMTVNLWIDWTRRRKRFPTFSLDSMAQEENRAAYEIASSEEDVERVYRREFWSAVWRAWGELPEHYRIVLKLRVVDELSYKEIAAVTGDTEAAVKSKLNRSRQMLKERLRKAGYPL
ncbi:sigma-70 family RNA polymerase sigma factor [Moorellaceae bacterium AZ2]